MKKIFLFISIVLVLISCSLNNEPENEIVQLPVVEVTMPATFSVGNISRILVRYKRPTQCHIFNGFYYNINESTRIVAIQCIKLKQNNCPVDPGDLYEVPLDFKPTVSGNYTFKFWLGTVDNMVDQYLTYEIVVQ